MDKEAEVYLRGILPLLDEEKVAQLLSKGAHVVDLVYDVAQNDERLREIVKSIYAAGTNQTLIRKMDGNNGLMTAGYTNFRDFYFNPEVTKEKFAEVASEDAVTNNSPTPYWKRAMEALYWDVPTASATTVFAGFVSSVLGEVTLPGNTERLEAAYNYLRFQMKRHGLKMPDAREFHEKVEARLPNVLSFESLEAVEGTEAETLGSIEERFKNKSRSNRSYGFSGMIMTGSMSYITGVSLVGSSGSFGSTWYTTYGT